MLNIAYLANQFPSPVEPYVADEIAELRNRGICVIAGSVRRSRDSDENSYSEEVVVVQSLQLSILFKALWLCMLRGTRILDLLGRIFFQGAELPLTRIKTLIHTILGTCYAAKLEPFDIDHIHVHHGYFGSWIGLVASRLLGVDYSLTLHGSDLLLHGAYLDVKLEACRSCFTVSDFNRDYILQCYPSIDPRKVMVARLGTALPHKEHMPQPTEQRSLQPSSQMTVLSVGRLHPVKDHAFLLRACAQLIARGIRLECLIAGEGPERKKLESLIRKYGLENVVGLLGHVPREQMDSLYTRADVVILTSRSEGIPLVLMEAMTRGLIVLAPAITGIPELVIPGKSGFLYQPGSQGDFISCLLLIHSQLTSPSRSLFPSVHKRLDWVRLGARAQVAHNFNRQTNLQLFADMFLRRVRPRTGSLPHEDFILQQI